MFLQKNVVGLLKKIVSKKDKGEFSAKWDKIKSTTINVHENWWNKYKNKIKIKFMLPIIYSVDQDLRLIY